MTKSLKERYKFVHKITVFSNGDIYAYEDKHLHVPLLMRMI